MVDGDDGWWLLLFIYLFHILFIYKEIWIMIDQLYHLPSHNLQSHNLPCHDQFTILPSYLTISWSIYHLMINLPSHDQFTWLMVFKFSLTCLLFSSTISLTIISPSNHKIYMTRWDGKLWEMIKNDQPSHLNSSLSLTSYLISFSEGIRWWWHGRWRWWLIVRW